MGRDTQVVVWGTTIHMLAIAAGLKADPSLQVLCLDPRGPDAARTLSTLAPAATLFDLSDPPPGTDIALLSERPELVLVGVDPHSDRMLVFSGRQERLDSVAELVQVILGGGARP